MCCRHPGLRVLDDSEARIAPSPTQCDHICHEAWEDLPDVVWASHDQVCPVCGAERDVWKCSCGWSGTPHELSIGSGGRRGVCPECRTNGGLVWGSPPRSQVAHEHHHVHSGHPVHSHDHTHTADMEGHDGTLSSIAAVHTGLKLTRREKWFVQW